MQNFVEKNFIYSLQSHTDERSWESTGSYEVHRYTFLSVTAEN